MLFLIPATLSMVLRDGLTLGCLFNRLGCLYLNNRNTTKNTRAGMSRDFSNMKLSNMISISKPNAANMITAHVAKD